MAERVEVRRDLPELAPPVLGFRESEIPIGQEVEVLTERSTQSVS